MLFFMMFCSSSVSLSLSAGSIVYLGMMFGAFFWGGLSDKVGRKQCLLISMTVNGFFAFLSSFVQGYSMFLFCRMVSGFGWVLYFLWIFSHFTNNPRFGWTLTMWEGGGRMEMQTSPENGNEHLPVLMCCTWLLTCLINDMTWYHLDLTSVLIPDHFHPPVSNVMLLRNLRLYGTFITVPLIIKMLEKKYIT